MAPNSQQPWDVHYPPTTQPVHFDSEEDEDIKAPYDDLIDQYAIPYHQNPNHKSYNVNAAAFKGPHPNGRPYSISQNTSRTSNITGKDLEGASPHAHDWAYPPPAAKEEVVKTSLWRRVRTARHRAQGASEHIPQILPDSLACKLYLLTVLVETTIDLAIEADLLVRLHDVDEGKEVVSKKMPVYLAIFALAQYVQQPLSAAYN